MSSIAKKLREIAVRLGVCGYEYLPYAAERLKGFADQLEQPIDMVLHCPKCRTQHIDKPEIIEGLRTPVTIWANPPHKSHLCHGCGHIWRSADVPTNGVAAVKTKGKNDS